MSRRLASIDIGTNTVLLLVAEIDAEGGMQTLAERQEMIRLGRNVDADRRITEDGIRAGARVLKQYAKIAESFEVEGIHAFGTSALRDASNRDAVLQRWRQETGVDVTLLSGADEALWTSRGGMMVFGCAIPEHAVIIDIGGGSTEIIYMNAGCLQSAISLDIGAVRLTERFLKKDPVDSIEESLLRNAVAGQLKRVTAVWPESTVAVGVAGTCTTLAAIIQEMEVYDPARINGFRVTAEALDTVMIRLRTMTHEDRKTVKGLQPSRADVIVAGGWILTEAMQTLKFAHVTISDFGLRHGLILKSL